ncbi:hypothetical protein RclHR1_01120021 [Rhizophagus clarus]|uniref:F-box domain-containing protein n=1 Tax=Rhizophagus clarus TaxID=94130 RepID=A0A2Z6Q3I8_9GLOM|nr:hypothetical protein RclHR1_01120021 [Rhizophagus clarus]GET04552.1 hypothetical protein GLOIN_2v1471287 [Rhizophagus clarus]
MQEISTVHSPIINIPSELFIEICSFLSPHELLTLSQVCRKFRGCLCAPNSLVTQQIWKDSRLKFMPKEDMPPPEGMSEEKYAELLMKERGCQICIRTKECRIYWEFAIRCCERCHSNKTMSQCLITKDKYPSEFVNIMPYSYNEPTKYYWKENVYLAYSQYNCLSENEKKIWLDNMKYIFNSIMDYVKQRKLQERSPSRLQPYLFVPDLRFSSFGFEEPLLAQPLFLLPSPSRPLHRSIGQIALIPKNNIFETSNKQKNDNFIKNKKELNNNFYNINMKVKGKNLKNKFAYKYG